MISLKVVGALAGLLAGLGAAGQTALAAGPVNQWHKSCQREVCVTVFQLGSRTGSLVIRVDPQAAQPIIMASELPPGVLLPFGATWQIDGDRERRLAFQDCNASRCVGRLEINEAFLDKMRRGNTFRLGATNRRGETVVQEITLSGFTRAFDGEPTVASSAMSQRTYRQLP